MKVCMIVLLLGISAGCTRISTGEIGLRKDFNGSISEHELQVGLHQTMVGEVIVFAVKEILLSEENLHPQSKDKSALDDFDITFTYVVAPNEVSYLYTKYSPTAHLRDEKNDEIFPMGAFVQGIVRASTYSAVADYDALEINNNRSQIETKIVAKANEKLIAEGLKDKVIVKMVNVKNIQLSADVIESANRAVKAQNDLKTKTTEVAIATQEALRIKELANQSGDAYIRLLNAQANKVQADALLVAAQNKGTIFVVPQNFTALGNIAVR